MVAMTEIAPSVALAEFDVLMFGRIWPRIRKAVAGIRADEWDQVTTRSGASQGQRSATISAQLARGVPAGVVILSREGLTELIAANKSPAERT